jgi:hypothetical protein
MITIPVQLPNDLARRVLPLQDRLPEIIELGLRQMEAAAKGETDARQQVLDALDSTGIVTLPQAGAEPGSRPRHTPIVAGGRPASELIIAERRGDV